MFKPPETTRRTRSALPNTNFPDDPDFPRHEYEVVVVVDGSTDGTSAMLRELEPPCGFQVLEQPNQGPAVARNHALAAARGEVVLFLDDDILCEPQVLGEHLLGHTGSAAAVVHGPIYCAPASPRVLPAEITADWYKAFYARLEATGGLELAAGCLPGQ